MNTDGFTKFNHLISEVYTDTSFAASWFARVIGRAYSLLSDKVINDIFKEYAVKVKEDLIEKGASQEHIAIAQKVVDDWDNDDIPVHSVLDDLMNHLIELGGTRKERDYIIELLENNGLSAASELICQDALNRDPNAFEEETK
jgi:hypothetical protein